MHYLPIVFGAISGGLGLAENVPYIRDIFRHKTKPERAMWWIYTALFSVLFVAQASAGARWLLLVSGEYILASAIIAILSVRYGYGKFHKRDVISLVIAGLGLAAWLLTDKSLVTIIIVIGVDFAGFWLTVVKTWYAPHSETLISWQLSCIGAVISIISASTKTLTVLIYPIYAVVATALFVWLIMYRRTKIKEDPVDF
jgi:hypothetical protein